MPSEEWLMLNQIKKKTIQNLSANPLTFFQELWGAPTIDRTNKWEDYITGTGTSDIILAVLNGRRHLLMNANTGADTTLIWSIYGFNCVPNFIASDVDKEDYIEKKLIIEFTMLEKTIGAATGVIQAGIWEAGLNAPADDGAYVQIDDTDTRVGIIDGGGAPTEVVTTETPDKVHIEVGAGFIEFYFGTILINRFEADMPDAFLHLVFSAIQDATLRLGPVLAWYEKVDIER